MRSPVVVDGGLERHWDRPVRALGAATNVDEVDWTKVVVEMPHQLILRRGARNGATPDGSLDGC